MKEQFVPYAIALSMKKLGFNEPCLGKWLNGTIDFPNPDYLESQEKVGYIYNGSILAPTYQQVVDWLITKHNIWVEIRYGKDHESVWFDYDIYSLIKPRKDAETGEDGVEYDDNPNERFLNYDTTYDSLLDDRFELYERDNHPTPQEAYLEAFDYILNKIL